MLLSGLLPKFEAEKKTDLVFKTHTLNLEQWSERSRYDLQGTHLTKEAIEFIESVKFITQWIKVN
jgi:hypothetical protein